ncbi:MAG: MBL fold metallo-hydrolase [Phycisphaerae bacterium]|nr:MBL fold metallo-hydrolase [Phycisphaerae bacterium]
MESDVSTISIKTFALGPLETNSYAVWISDDCWVIDVGMLPANLEEFLEAENLSPSKILLTHGHGDHIGGVEFLVKNFPDAKIHCPTADEEMLSSPTKNLSGALLMSIVSPPADVLINPGDTFEMGGSEWKVLDTAGHTPGGVSFYCPQAGVVFTGDALFCGSIGRSDIPNGNSTLLLENIRNNLMTLPDDTRVLPGHGPETTIGEERRSNPFIN